MYGMDLTYIWVGTNIVMYIFWPNVYDLWLLLAKFLHKIVTSAGFCIEIVLDFPLVFFFLSFSGSSNSVCCKNGMMNNTNSEKRK